jgi:purine nucleoside phosphorylase
MAHPVCRRLGEAVEATAKAEGMHVVRGGTYIAMDGPQLSSQAECAANRALGADVIGMTNMPEAKLAREAEMCYATVAMVTDYDCWHPNDIEGLTNKHWTLSRVGWRAGRVLPRVCHSGLVFSAGAARH